MNDPFDRKRVPPRASTDARGPAQSAYSRPTATAVSRSEEDDARSSSKHRAALEALFAPKATPAPAETQAQERPSKKMVAAPSREEPGGPVREKRLAKLLAAEGRAAVTQAADAFTGAGFAFPDEQEVMLKLLEHDDESRVKEALDALTRLLEAEAPQRRTILEARLRRLEDADDADVRALASSLRRRLLTRPAR